MDNFDKVKGQINGLNAEFESEAGQPAGPTTRTAKTKFQASNNIAELRIDGVTIHINRESSDNGSIGYAEGPDNIGTTLYNNQCIQNLIEDVLGITPPPGSKAVYETVNNWLRDWSEQGRKCLEVAF